MDKHPEKSHGRINRYPGCNDENGTNKCHSAEVKKRQLLDQAAILRVRWGGSDNVPRLFQNFPLPTCFEP